MIKISKLLIFSQNLVNKFYLNRSRRYKILVTEDRSREISRKFKDRSNIYSIFSRFRNDCVILASLQFHPQQYRIHGKKNSKRSLRGILSFFFVFFFSRYSHLSRNEKIFSFLLLMHYVIRISTSNHAAHREIHTRATPNSGAHAYEFDFCKRVRIRIEAAHRNCGDTCSR